MSSTGRVVVVLLLAVLVVAAMLLWRVGSHWIPSATPTDTEARANLVGKPLPSLAPLPAWLHGRVWGRDSLAGHPTVLLLWRDTDPLSVRAARRAEAWHSAYARYGLRVVGVHVPEFAFAADTAQVAREPARLGLSFPQALDPSLVMWSALGADRACPRILFADARGKVTVDATASQAADVERAIRAAIRDAHPELDFPRDPGAVTTNAGASDGPPPSLLLGSLRVKFGPLARAMPGRDELYTPRYRTEIEGDPLVPYPVGMWRLSAEGLTAGRGGADNYLALRYDRGALGAVMSPPATGPVRVWILRDEAWLAPDQLGADARLDGRGASYVDVDAARLYAICAAAPGQHVAKLSPEAPGLTVHAFTFDEPDADATPKP